METELKKARKRSFTLEGMLLNRPNGIYDTRKYFEMCDEYNEDSRDLTTKTNDMTDYSLDDVGSSNEITDESCDHGNMTDESHEHMRINHTRKKAVNSYVGRTNHTKEDSQDFTRTTCDIRDSESEDSTENIKLSERNMADDPHDSAERISQITKKIHDQDKDHLKQENDSLNFDINNNSETGIEAYENRTCLGDHERNLPKDESIKETSSSIDDSCNEVFYQLEWKRHISVGRVNHTRRRSSI